MLMINQLTQHGKYLLDIDKSNIFPGTEENISCPKCSYSYTQIIFHNKIIVAACNNCNILVGFYHDSIELHMSIDTTVFECASCITEFILPLPRNVSCQLYCINCKTNFELIVRACPVCVICDRILVYG